MSLLMDALKQAEHAKRGSKQDTQTPSSPTAVAPVPEPETGDKAQPAAAPVTANAELSLSPVEPAQSDTRQAAEKFDTAPAADPLPDSAITDEPATAARLAPEPEPDIAPDTVTPKTVEREIPSEPAGGTPAVEAAPATAEPAAPQLALAATGTDRSAQAAARVLAASEAHATAQRRRSLYGVVGLTALVLLAIGGYYYGSGISHSQPQMVVPDLPDTAPQVEGPAEPMTVAEPAPAPAETPWRAGPAPQTASDWEPAPVDIRVLRGESPAEPESTPPVAEPAAPRASISISRSTRSDRVSDALQTAYLDYQAGRHAQATEGYRQVLAHEPGNRDARLGLAALAVQRGETETARTLYRELLRLDPKDSAAQAALASLQTQPSADTESELKLLLAEQPDSAQLHFALANVFAAQARWALAQQSYFEAQRLAPQHPDYAFNLAVSLEHLSQAQPALEYYRRALALAARQPAGFDVATAEARVHALAMQAGP